MVIKLTGSDQAQLTDNARKRLAIPSFDAVCGVSRIVLDGAKGRSIGRRIRQEPILKPEELLESPNVALRQRICMPAAPYCSLTPGGAIAMTARTADRGVGYKRRSGPNPPGRYRLTKLWKLLWRLDLLVLQRVTRVRLHPVFMAQHLTVEFVHQQVDRGVHVAVCRFGV